MWFAYCCIFFFQAEDGIRDAQESRGLGDVYKRQVGGGTAGGSGGSRESSFRSRFSSKLPGLRPLSREKRGEFSLYLMGWNGRDGLEGNGSLAGG